jgi:hypothetical protein
MQFFVCSCMCVKFLKKTAGICCLGALRQIGAGFLAVFRQLVTGCLDDFVSSQQVA